MHIDLVINSTWSDFTLKATELLNLNPDTVRVQFYKGLYHSIFDITQGLVKQFPHKKKVFYFKSVSPLIDKSMAVLAKSGYKVVALNYDQMADLDSWLEQVDRETLYVVYPEDDPVVGKALGTDKIKEAFNDKRVFQIQVNHALHFSYGINKNPNRYELPIYSVNKDLAVAAVGDKARGVDGLNSGMYWDESATLSQLEVLTNPVDSKDKVLQFEADLPEEFHLATAKDSIRAFDRVAFYFEDMDGEAFIQTLAKKLGVELNAPGMNSQLESASLSRWGGVRTMDWLVNLGWSISQVRGMVVISHELLSAELLEQLKQVRAEVLQLQNG